MAVEVVVVVERLADVCCEVYDGVVEVFVHFACVAMLADVVGDADDDFDYDGDDDVDNYSRIDYGFLYLEHIVASKFDDEILDCLLLLLRRLHYNLVQARRPRPPLWPSSRANGRAR